jgi:hypothetical protein
MDEVNHKRFLVVGFPSTGKTTFLAALWNIVESAEIKCSLVLKELHGNRGHLNKIRGKWLGCQALERTKPIDEQMVSMKLVHPDSGKTTEVFFPDMSGESFKSQWEKRHWTKWYAKLVEESAGILLFVHPDQVAEATRIDEANQLMAQLPSLDFPIETTEEEFVEWDLSRTPTQVKLVELLQFIFAHRSAKLLRICIIVSAWDLICTSGKSPDEWVDSRLPLLSQYLRANLDNCSYKVFGVSAQGGDLEEDSDRLLEYAVPSKRIIVVGLDCRSHDLTSPVAWLMS